SRAVQLQRSDTLEGLKSFILPHKVFERAGQTEGNFTGARGKRSVKWGRAVKHVVVCLQFQVGAKMNRRRAPLVLNKKLAGVPASSRAEQALACIDQPEFGKSVLVRLDRRIGQGH